MGLISKLCILAMLAATFTACTDDERNDNLLLLEDQQTPIVEDNPFSSTTKSELATEMRNKVGKRFTCDQSVIRSDCFDAAKVILSIHNADGSLPTIAKRLRIDSFDNINNKNRVTLDYRHGEDAMRNVFRNHTARWSQTNPPLDPNGAFHQLALYVYQQLGLELSCHIDINPCYYTVERVVRAFAEVPRRRMIERLIVMQTANPVLEQKTLFVGPQTALSTIKGLIHRNHTAEPEPAPEPNLKSVRERLKNISGKNLICDSQTNKRQCTRVGRKIIQAYQTGRVPSTRLRRFVATVKTTRTVNSPNVLEIKLSDNVETIIRLLERHHSRYR